MKTYFAIKNSDCRYLKIRQNGNTRNWVKDVKGASVGTEAQMKSCLDALKRSPYYETCELVKVGESDSSWKAKLDIVKQTDSKNI